MPQLHNIRAIFSLRFPIFSNWNQLWYKFYLFISIEGQLLHRILQSSVKPQHESAIGIHISPPSWNSLPPPFPSHSSRLTQSPFSQSPEPYSKFPLAIHFTRGSVSFVTQTWEASWIAEAPRVFTSTLFLSLANAISGFAFIFSSASAWLLHWSRPEVPQWSHHLSFPSKLHPAILGVQKRKKVKVLVTQSCPILFDPMDCSPPGASVHRIPQARKLEWAAFPSPGIFSAQESNSGLLHCKQVLYQFSHQGSHPPNILLLHEDYFESKAMETLQF